MEGSPTSRACALTLLDQVLGAGGALDEALEAAFAGPYAGLSPRDRAFARLLCATVLRRLGEIDAVLARLLERPLPERAGRLRNVLRLGAAQLLFLGTPAHAAVDTAVALVGHGARAKGLINAVLRRIARESSTLTAGHDAARLNTPAWLWASWRAAYGEDVARAIAQAHLEEPPLDLSVKGAAAAWAGRLEAALLPTGSLRRRTGGEVSKLPGYADGAWWVQDAAATLPARLLGNVEGKRVVDLCAAPGGKTAQLAAAGARVTALDRSGPRLVRLEANLARLGLGAETVVADATEWRPEGAVEAILLDAPCSGTGIIRRHPDIARLKGERDVTRLAQLQARLLAAAAAYLAPGGVLVYCACSLEPEECERQVAALLEREPGLSRRPVRAAELDGQAELITPAGDLRTLPSHWPELGGLDGFYAARLERRT